MIDDVAKIGHQFNKGGSFLKRTEVSFTESAT
jgi:hypothetical protein